jgi:inner membrane protein
MMASTHAALGVVTYAGVTAIAGGNPIPATLGAAAVGAWLPDVDTPQSKAGFCVYPLALWLERRYGHRTVTHSWIGVAVFALLCLPLLFSPALKVLYWPLLIGYLSHLMGDAATKSGVPLAWPSRARFVFPGNEAYRLRTGSMAELGVLAALLLVGAALVPLNRYGPRRLLHLATGTQQGALRDAEDWSQEWKIEAEVEGFDVLHQKMVSGRFPVVGRRGDGSLIIERKGAGAESGFWKVADGGEELHRIKPRRIRIFQVAPRSMRTTAARVSNCTLGALSRSLPSGVLLSGLGECYPLPQDSQNAPRDAPRFGLKTVRFASTRVEFDLARPEHLRQAGARVALREATLSVEMPRTAKLLNLQRPTRREVLTVGHMRRHGDLFIKAGDLVQRGQTLNRTFRQELQAAITPDETRRQAEAENARRELSALDVEEAALKGSPLWSTLRAGFETRRANLQRMASYQAPAPPTAPTYPATRAPFDAVVEAVEWEPPTLPTQPGEIPEHAAQVTIAEVAR